MIIKRASSVLCCFVFFIVHVSHSTAQTKGWKHVYSGYGLTVGINPINPNTLYGVGSTNLYVSHDGGKNWTPSYNTPSGFPNSQLRQILIHPKDTLVMFIAGSGPALYRSSDGGMTWSVVIPSYGIDGQAIVYDPIHPDTMYAANFDNGKLYRSTNRGITWTLMGNVGGEPCTLAVRPDSANILLAGSGAGTISKSTNSGTTWRQVKSGGSIEIPRIVIDPENPRTAYAAAYEGNPSSTGVWKSTDGGENWILIGLQGVSMWSLDIDPLHPDTLYAGNFSENNAGVFRTTDAGATWQLLSKGFFPQNSMWTIKVDPINTNNVYVSVSDQAFGWLGVYKLSDMLASIDGVLRDQLTDNPITSGSLYIQQTGMSLNLGATGGGYSLNRFSDDIDSVFTLDYYHGASPVLGLEEQFTLYTDSFLVHDIYYQPGIITGTVFNDQNNDSTWDPGEPVMSNVTIQLSGDVSSYHQSDVNGVYQFDDLLPGNYTVTPQPRYGTTQTYPVSSSYTLQVSSLSKNYVTKDFGFNFHPIVISTVPHAYSHNYPQLQNIQVTFDNAMDINTFNDTASFIVSGSVTGRHRGTFTFGSGNTVATFIPIVPFQAGEIVTADVSSALLTATAEIITPFVFSFPISPSQAPGSFLKKADYAVGGQPSAIAVGDIDGDGDADFVTANTSENTVSVLRNNGNGIYGSRVDYSTGDSPIAVALGDIDNDGDVDIVVGNNLGQKISVLKNNGNGIFSPKIDYSSGGRPFALSLADMDGDGFLDVITSNFVTDAIVVMKNNGTGAFPSVNIFPASTIVALSTSDINGDGGIDVLSATYSPNAILKPFLNVGEGVLGTQPSYNVGSIPTSILVTDVSGDSIPDIVTSNFGSGSITILANQGSGTFGNRIDYNVGSAPWSIASGNIGGDGGTDLVVTNSGADSITVMVNNGNGTFSNTSYIVGGAPNGVALADIDNDGDLDIVVANSFDNTVSILLNSSIVTSTAAPGWNLVSIPVRLEDYSKGVIYPNAISAAFGYAQGYRIADTLKQGAGYWVKFSEAQTIFYAGNEITNDTIDLRPKWNIIGGPSVPVDTSMMYSDSPGLIISKFFGFDTGYSSTTTLLPGIGYWVKASHAGKLIISTSVAMSARNKINVVEISELPPAPPEGEVTTEKSGIPKEFALEQNYPNPFNPTTEIRYQISEISHVTLKVFDVLGREVATLVNRVEHPGYKSLEWNASNMPSGLYICRLQSEKFTVAKKLVLIK